jgi:hypothetical protein
VGRREEVYNVTLAALLRKYGGDLQGEDRQGQNIPDVHGMWHGIGLVIECKYQSRTAREELSGQLTNRFESGFGPLGVAVIYPREWKDDTRDPDAVLSGKIEVSFRWSDGRRTEWEGVVGVDALRSLLNSARDLSTNDAELVQAVEDLNGVVEIIARTLSRQPGHLVELTHLLTTANPISSDDPTPEEQDAARKVAGLTIATALMLQHHLAPLDAAVPSVPNPDSTSRSTMRERLIKSWNVVLKHDYSSVFSIAHGVLSLMSDEETLDFALKTSTKSTSRIVQRRVLGRHDLVGRVYHTLLISQKYLATYYTSVSAATLLAALAIDPRLWPGVDWSLERPTFSVADPACGTGTLLVSAMTMIQQNYLTARAEKREPINLPALSKHLIEDGTFGYDILAYALQVAAATLLLSAPGVVLDRTNFVQMPFGGPNGALGSLDFLAGRAEIPGTLFDAVGIQQGLDTGNGAGEGPATMVALPQVDLVIMNPPFTRSQHGSRMFGSLPANELKRAREKLSRLGRTDAVQVGTKAGLGAMFLPLASAMVRPMGRVAFVLPKALLTGKDWEPARRLLANDFHVEVIVASHEPGRWNFSDSTDLSEVLVIGRKFARESRPEDLETLWINLIENPDTAIDAKGIAEAIGSASPNADGIEIKSGGGAFDVKGYAWTRSAPLSGDIWPHAIFANGTLDRVSDDLRNRRTVRLPRTAAPTSLPLISLGELGIFGKDVRDVYDAFVPVDHQTEYSALWGNKSEKNFSMSGQPNKYLQMRTAPAVGRPLLDSELVWATAGKLMIAARPRFNTNQVSAVLLDDEALGSSWWPFTLYEDERVSYQFLTLWLNSSIGLITYLGVGDETEGPFFNIKKNKLQDLPVPDPRQLSSGELAMVSDAWSELASLRLQAMSGASSDPVRARIDRIFAQMYSIPDTALLALRRLFSAEARFGQSRVKPSELAPPPIPTLFDSI